MLLNVWLLGAINNCLEAVILSFKKKNTNQVAKITTFIAESILSQPLLLCRVTRPSQSRKDEPLG